MSFGRNLQFLRRMHRGMTQEELAERLEVSRQTISKWELDMAFPEMEKAVSLCQLFSCTLDELLRQDMDSGNDAYINFHTETVPQFRYVQYTVISPDPEGDAIQHVTSWAITHGIEKSEIIGWDFPYVSQEQINVFHMHGYTAACILPENSNDTSQEIVTQKPQKYAVITIKEPFVAPFTLIPNAYKTLIRYMDINGLKHRESKDAISCFEKSYTKDGVTYMDVYISTES